MSPTVAHHPDRRGTRHPRPQLARARTPSPRSSTPWGARAGEGLGADEVSRIFKRMAREADLPGEVVERISGHSTRVRYKSDDHPRDRYIGGRWTVTR